MMDFPYNIVLGSASPRRRELLTAMGLKFEVRTQGSDESAPAGLSPEECVEWIARMKAGELLPGLAADELLITADTEVWQDGRRFGKPTDAAEAETMLQKLSGTEHWVISGVHLCTRQRAHSFHVSTRVLFNPLSLADIRWYVEKYKPFDKAGAYGIQEWAGMVGIGRIEGSYTNVVGLPCAELWEAIFRGDW